MAGIKNKLKTNWQSKNVTFILFVT